MNLSELIAGLGVRPVDPAAAGLRVCDLTDDSRTVVPGSLFIARRGTKADGRAFIKDAVAAGAVAVLTDDASVRLPDRAPAVLLLADPGTLPRAAARMAERFHGDPTSGLTLIGVTGTKGKTTTAHLIHRVLNASGTRCGLIGTVVVDDGVEVAPATLTTPPATELSRTFARMLEAGCRAAVMEVSSHALDQGRVAGLRFQVGVFTNLSGDHLDYHGTMENYARAKAQLFAMLPAEGAAVINAEDPAAETMVGACRASVIRCSIRERGDDCRVLPDRCCASVDAADMGGTRGAFRGPWGEFDADLRLVGRHNVMNALQAVAACWSAGVEADDLRPAIARAEAPPGRLEPVTGPDDPFTVFVDYAHTDDAIRKTLEALRPLVPRAGRLRIVFGCGGDRDRTKRPRMGAAASELADDVYLTSDNPRTEDPAAIIAEVLAGIDPTRRAAVVIEPDRREATRRAVSDVRPGDILLIAGKGHETYQVLPDGRGGTRTIEFDDRAVARDALRTRRSTAAPVPAAVVTGPARGATLRSTRRP
ncbi:MAG: UDP-N-acetylmuramoyl-L-alanyl-D-glutamate--2,6-diaminopimelate ligase [Phycisphaerales bacterium]